MHVPLLRTHHPVFITHYSELHSVTQWG